MSHALDGGGREPPPTEATQNITATKPAGFVLKIPLTGIPLEDIERHALIEALIMCNWIQKDAAELLSISQRVMNYKMKTHGIRRTHDPKT